MPLNLYCSYSSIVRLFHRPYNMSITIILVTTTTATKHSQAPLMPVGTWMAGLDVPLFGCLVCCVVLNQGIPSNAQKLLFYFHQSKIIERKMFCCSFVIQNGLTHILSALLLLLLLCCFFKLIYSNYFNRNAICWNICIH